MTRSGGPAAIRGFRLQTTYALVRLLQGERVQQFKPEGKEDLDVLDALGNAIEHVQVKAYGQPLQFAHLAEQEGEGSKAEPPYFERVLKRLKESGTQERLVSFGPVGPELQLAWKEEGVARERVRVKFQQRGYAENDINLIFSNLTFEVISEEQQHQAAQSILREGMTAGDVEFSLDALSWWLFRQSELGAVIPLSTFQERVQRVGQHLLETAAGQQVWGYALTPLRTDPLRAQSPHTLRQELYEGIGARLEHIVANVDVRREVPLGQLEEAFETHPLVVLHGASGQGKSALAYRFLHEQAQTAFTYELNRLESLEQARQVILAVQGRLRVTSTPLWLLVDAPPGETNWLEVVRDLAGLPDVHILVTMREENWGRVRTAFEALVHRELPLSFNELEARTLFQSLVAVRPSVGFLGFDEAWRRFELRGPLLEFVYMVTHEGQQLHARLAAQVEALEQLWAEDGAKLDFLHAASMAAAFGARVDTLKLAAACQLHPRKLKSVLDRLEHEHLLRVNGETTVEGLHAVRSALLFDLLSSPETPPLRAFQQVVGSVLESDLEFFLLHALLPLPQQEVTSFLQQYTPPTWTGWLAVIRSLIWLGVYEHLSRTRDIIQKGFDSFEFGFWMYLHIDLLGLRVQGLLAEPTDWASLTYLPDHMREEARRISALNFPPQADFTDAKRWWETERQAPPIPSSVKDWLSLAESAFYVGLWGLSRQRFEGMDVGSVEALPLREASQVHFGLTNVLYPSELSALQQSLLTRFKAEASILSLTDDGVTINIHFVMAEERDPLDPAAVIDGSDKSNLAARMRRLTLLRQLVPDREKYACQGYGHRMALLPVMADGTYGDMPRENLPPSWGTAWNRTFIRLAERDYLLLDWQVQADHQWQRRLGVVETLEQAYEALSQGDATRKEKMLSASTILDNHQRMLSHLKPPRNSVDPWGLAVDDEEEGNDAPLRLGQQFDSSVHDPYFQAIRQFMASAHHFLFQGAWALMLNAHLRGWKDRNQAAKLRFKYKHELRFIHLSAANLTDVQERLPEMQRQYRQRLGHLLKKEELTVLERREQQVISSLWNVWGQFAQPLTGTHSGKTAEEIAVGLQRHLDNALKQLNQFGLKLTLIPSTRPFEGQSALWFQLELSHTTHLYAFIQTALLSFHHWIASVQDDRYKEVLFHRWPRIIIVPTREGQPWRAGVFVYLTLLLQEEPQQEQWWRHVPKELTPEDLEQLGFHCHATEPSPCIQALRVAILRYLQLVSRQRDLARVFDLGTDDVSDDVFAELDAKIQECEKLIGSLCDGQFGEMFPELAQRIKVVIVDGLSMDGWAVEVQQQLPVMPEAADQAAAGAILLLLELEQATLEEEERQMTS